jgi:hypothetical protein
MSRDGSSVALRSAARPSSPPASVMVPSAATRASVPASVDSRPPLYVPRDSRDDITCDSSDRFTPSSTSADTNVSSAEHMYCATVYVPATRKLSRTPASSTTSDASRICLRGSKPRQKKKKKSSSPDHLRTTPTCPRTCC